MPSSPFPKGRRASRRDMARRSGNGIGGMAARCPA
jgi:hypothetical protein